MEEVRIRYLFAGRCYYYWKENNSNIKKETEIDSLWNTYRYNDLSLDPICNPGFESILTSIYYKDSEQLYHLTTPERKTIFNRVLKEHNIAKAKYLKDSK